MSDATPKRGRPKTFDDAVVLDLAMTAFWHADPADVSLNAICQRAGVAKPALYRAFGNEDGLTRAALDLYAERILSEVFEILGAGLSLRETLAAITAWASRAPQMTEGCLFTKMRAGKHRLGPRTRDRVDEIEAAGIAAYTAFLSDRQDAGDIALPMPVEMAARYIFDQVGLALTRRAAGEKEADIEAGLTLALSVLTPAQGQTP